MDILLIAIFLDIILDLISF